jgi:hypothetical protein
VLTSTSEASFYEDAELVQWTCLLAVLGVVPHRACVLLLIDFSAKLNVTAETVLRKVVVAVVASHTKAILPLITCFK